MLKKDTLNMLKKIANTEILFDKLVESAKEKADDRRQILLAKKMYLIKNEESIRQAREAGYTYSMIAMAATAELLEMDIPKSFITKKKDGEEVTVETGIRPGEIIRICEPKGEE
ncbi:MAG: hypothetical protein DRG30_01205 [Epsilonproteobacteria bacterium]|nr:MAG: hypothetical protein DRG30_01205 [Campylobacterota bacterium]